MKQLIVLLTTVILGITLAGTVQQLGEPVTSGMGTVTGQVRSLIATQAAINN